jgi:histidine phosphotransferase ChpT
MHIELRILELLSSKICHDLISPVGAINNGVELITEVGGDVVDEAMKLIGDSAAQAAKKLRLFRLCYGRAGSESNVTTKDARTVVEDYLSTSKIKFSWPQDLPNDAFVESKGALKVLVNVILLAEESLAYGGAISVGHHSDPSIVGCVVEATGRAATLSPGTIACLEEKTIVDEITPRTVHAYIAAQFAKTYGFRLAYDLSSLEKVTYVLGKAA